MTILLDDQMPFHSQILILYSKVDNPMKLMDLRMW